MDFFFVDAPELMIRALEEYRKLGLKTHKAECLCYYRLGFFYRNLGYFETALKYFFKALSLAKYCNLKNTNILSEIYRFTAMILKDKGAKL